jgi:hypothetical protein
MKLEDQVCSLDLAKRLKELGVKQHSYFHYSLPNPDKAKTVEDKYGLKKCKVEITTTHWGTMFDEYAAFTVAELGEMLPVSIKMNGETHWYDSNKTTHTHRCGYIYIHGETTGWGRVSDVTSHAVGEAKTEADARAKMLIYLLENKLIDKSAPVAESA